jgi:hypothetical protein
VQWQYVKELQEHYNRVSIVLQNARNPLQRTAPLPANNGAISRQPNTLPAPALNLEEILRLHGQCQSVWRQTYDTLRMLSNQPDCTQLTICPSSSDVPVAQQRTGLERPLQTGDAGYEATYRRHGLVFTPET